MNEPRLPVDLSARIKVLTIVTAVLVGSVFYRILSSNHLEHTSLVFIGVPALMAVVVALAPRPKTATGLIFKVMALALLIWNIAFGEAFVCILFASPLFFAVGAIIGTLIDRVRWQARSRIRAWFLLALVLTPASIEGVVPQLEFDRIDRVTATQVIDASAVQVSEMLAQTPRFDRPLPMFLQFGFPRPGVTSGSGLHVGAVRNIEFLHGHHPGVLSLRVERSEPGRVVFGIAGDTSYLTHWLSWRDAEVRWQALPDQRTEVSWVLTYRRRLDPSWYFAPLERYGTQQAARYLLQTLTTPSTRPTS